MKKFILICLIVPSLLISLTACQRDQTDSDNTKIQESLEKMKAKIQENIPTDSENKENDSSKQNNQKDEKSDNQNPNEPNTAE